MSDDAVRPSTPDADIQAIARGGRTNLIGFLLRLAARIPFLIIAGRFYGADDLGRFASALVVVELVALVCSLGEKRGLAQRLTDGEGDGDKGGSPTNLVYDGLLVALLLSGAAALLFWLWPDPLFPNGMNGSLDRLIVLAIPGYALTEILLAAQAYRFDIATTVRARAVVEPWTISILAGAFWFVPAVSESGLAMAYLASIYAGLFTALWTFARNYGLPKRWNLRASRMARMTWRALPLALADAIEWGTRRVDIVILGVYAGAEAVGIYYAAQQVASLPQKLKTSFEPILGPVITRALKDKDYAAIARQVCQVGFWITAAQAGIALALGIPGEAIMGLTGPVFVGGTAALAFLLAAEVVAATAVVSEAALIYVARVRNLWVSIGVIALQAVLTVIGMEIVGRIEWEDGTRVDLYRAAAAAAALMLALAVSSLVKSRMLARILQQGINNWRWPLVWAAGAAVIAGQLAIRLPEWAELVFGIPLILLAYGFVIWTRGFGPEDRVLFRRKAEAEAAPTAPAPATPD